MPIAPVRPDASGLPDPAFADCPIITRRRVAHAPAAAQPLHPDLDPTGAGR
jgi:hypothetical protein